MPSPETDRTAARMRRAVDRHLADHRVLPPTGNVSTLLDGILLALASELESLRDHDPPTSPHGQVPEGVRPGAPRHTCPHCHGSGRVFRRDTRDYGPCGKCGGTGRAR